MFSREQRFRLRIFLLISVLILVIILALFLFPGFDKAVDRYFINFRKISVSGLVEGATVRYQGVDVGNVTKITVNPEDLSSILVDVDIKKGFPVKKDMRATLAYLGITGMKFIELSGGESHSQNLPPRGEISTQKGLGEKAEDIVSNIDRAVKKINSLLSDDNLKSISLSLENIEKTSLTVESVMSGKRLALENALNNIEKTTTALRRVAERLGSATESAGLDGLAKTGRSALDNIDQRFSNEELGKVLKNLDEFLSTANSAIKKLNQLIINQQEVLGNSMKRLADITDNLSRFSRILVEDPTVLIRKRNAKRRKK